MIKDVDFKNDSVKNLYNKLHSYEVSQLETTNQIKEILYPYIKNVIDDNEAYKEAINFYEFQPIKTHIEDGEKYFINLDLETSLSVLLFLYVYH